MAAASALGTVRPLVNIQDRPDGGLKASIDTGEYTLDSDHGTERTFCDYLTLFQNRDAMKTFENGETYSCEKVAYYVKEWAAGWYNRDPIGSFSIYSKETRQFVGHIRLEREPDTPNAAEIIYLVHPDYWNHGIASKAAKAVVYFFVPEIVQRGLLERNPVNKLTATVLQTNTYSERILKNTLGMDCVEIGRERTDFRGIRNFYELSVAEICGIRV